MEVVETQLIWPLGKLPEAARLQAGPKASNLDRLIRAGFRVPKGFVISTAAYHQFIAENQLVLPLRRLLERAAPNNLYVIAAEIKKLFETGNLSPDLRDAVTAGLGALQRNAFAVRSSAVDEDGEHASFAGLHGTFLDVSEAQVFEKIGECYTSLYTPRALFYRLQKGLPLESAMAVLVQTMAPAKFSGVAFTSHPAAGQTTIEFVRGNGSKLVSGEIAPKRLVVSEGEKISEDEVSGFSVAPLHALASVFDKIESLFGRAQDIEWSFAAGEAQILQIRPQTHRPVQMVISQSILAPSESPVIEGLVLAAPLGSIPTEPYILFVDKPSPQYLPSLANARAVVAEKGGLLNHFAILCREFGIPFVVVKNASEFLRLGKQIRLDIRPSLAQESRAVSSDGWVTLVQFIPEHEDPAYLARTRKTVQRIPGILGLEFPLQSKIDKTGIYLHETGLERLIASAKSDTEHTRRRLEKQLEEPYDLATGLLAAVLMSPLFEHLVEITGSRETALRLLRGVDPFYLSFGENYISRGDEPYLLRFGIKEGTEFGIPAGLLETSSEKKMQHRVQTKALLEPLGGRDGEAAAVCAILRLLTRAYESKNRKKDE